MASFEHSSPTLGAITDTTLPDPPPACETCPAGIWHATEMVLRCYCTVMHTITWQKTEKPILLCDGREQAIARAIAHTKAEAQSDLI